MNEKDPLQLVMITAPDLETAQRMAKALVSSKVAACVNISPALLSIYHWEGAIQEDQEVLMLVKTSQNLVETRLIPMIQELHPYDLPEIISLPILGGSQEYLDWIREETEENPPE